MIMRVMSHRVIVDEVEFANVPEIQREIVRAVLELPREEFAAGAGAIEITYGPDNMKVSTRKEYKRKRN